MGVKMSCYSPNDFEYQYYSREFHSAWMDSRKSAQIHAIYLDKDRRSKSSNRGRRFQNHAMKAGGRTKITFHGTQRACHVGYSSSKGSKLRFCRGRDCYLCSILGGSFRVDKAGAGGMFGRGIYTSPYSSKADRYTRNHRIKSNLHAMIICEVVYNNPQPMYQAVPMTRPMAGYDCVEGVPTTYGGSLLNPEIVVYRDDAILPIGVIMYSRQGWDPAR